MANVDNPDRPNQTSGQNPQTQGQGQRSQTQGQGQRSQTQGTQRGSESGLGSKGPSSVQGSSGQSGSSGQGDYSFRCADAGYKECNWQTHGSSPDEVMRNVEQHGRQHHNITNLDEETRNRVRSNIRRAA